ncbi:MAG: NAD(P)-dependent oxidoreductase [Eubacteriales bacterium]
MDWTGNSNSIYKTLGASNHTDKARENDDFYATEPKAMDLLLQEENFNLSVWECACGQGHLSEQLKAAQYIVRSTDLIYRGYGEGGVDFLKTTEEWSGDIITNPPYKYATEFIYKALDIISNGDKVAMFLKIQFLEGKARKALFKKYPPKTIYVSSSRLLCAKNAEFQAMRDGGGSAVAYAWFVWQKGYTGETVVRWIN